MTGQISSLSIELVVGVVAASMLIGAVDVIRQPGWAWKQVEESKPAYLILVLLLPVIGIAMYALRARPKVTAAVAAGGSRGAVIDAAVIDTTAQSDQPVPRTDTIPAPADPSRAAAGVPEAHPGPEPHAVSASNDPFTGFRDVSDHGHPGPWETGAARDESAAFEVSSTFFSTEATTRSMRHPLALARSYRPKQRTALTEERAGAAPQDEPEPVTAVANVPEAVTATAFEPASEPAAAPVEAPAIPVPMPTSVAGSPTVPSGWKVDPTGRHQFRYWDGFNWTENVADNGDESRDAVVTVG